MISFLQILTGVDYYWCNLKENLTTDIYLDEKFPLCRVHKDGTITPGALITSKKCRIGHNGEVLYFESPNFEVLTNTEC